MSIVRADATIGVDLITGRPARVTNGRDVEDSAALLGLFFAFMGVLLSQVTRHEEWDGVGSVAVGVLLAFVVLLLITQSLARLPWPLWLTSLVIFVLAWIGQFIGHAVEGRRPSFFKDLQFLLIGPLWLLAAAYRRFSLPY